MHSKLLIDPCITISYTYLVASAKKKDTGPALLNGAMTFLNLMQRGFGGTIGRDRNTANEMDLRLGEGNCEHDELKFELPDGEEGFDLSFDLLVQTKPSDEINVAVSQDSIARIYTHSTNAKN